MENETCQKNLSLTSVRTVRCVNVNRTQHEVKRKTGKAESTCLVQAVKKKNQSHSGKQNQEFSILKQRFDLLTIEIYTHLLINICEYVQGNKKSYVLEQTQSEIVCQLRLR